MSLFLAFFLFPTLENGFPCPMRPSNPSFSYPSLFLNLSLPLLNPYLLFLAWPSFLILPILLFLAWPWLIPYPYLIPCRPFKFCQHLLRLCNHQEAHDTSALKCEATRYSTKMPPEVSSVTLSSGAVVGARVCCCDFESFYLGGTHSYHSPWPLS